MEFGKWRFCDKESIRKIVGNNDTNMKISVIPDVGRINYKEDSVIDMVGIATYIEGIPQAIEVIENIKNTGYIVTYYGNIKGN